MKLEKIGLACFWIIVIVAVLATPVAAGKPVDTYTMQYTQVPWIYPPEFIPTGSALHLAFTLQGPIDSTYDPLVDAVLIVAATEVMPLMNPHPTVGSHSWGAAQAKWRLVKGDSGFEGTAHLGPWTDLSLNHNALILSGSGQGFGEFKNMHLWFTVDITADDATSWIWSFEIR